MKLLITIALSVALISITASCNKKVYCTTPTINGFALTSADSIPDTAANFVKYTRGSNFTGFIDSSGSVPFAVDYAAYNQKQASFPNSGADTYNYDWIVILRPSGKTYQVKNISHQSNYVKQSYFSEIQEYCTNNISCTVNDISYVSALGNTQSSSLSVLIYATY